MTHRDEIDSTAGAALLVAAARARIQDADPAELARDASASIFDFASCVHGGRARMDASWADEPERLALEAHALDRDDVHPTALVHAGGIIWPAMGQLARHMAWEERTVYTLLSSTCSDDDLWSMGVELDREIEKTGRERRLAIMTLFRAQPLEQGWATTRLAMSVAQSQ